MPKDIKEKINELLDKKNQADIVNQLKSINDLFLRTYKLKIENKEIIPLETEIYYHNKNQQFEDKMIHKNEDLQKNHFGKLYFHRYKKKNQNNKNNIINMLRGGVDICLSGGEYFLSILLRSIILIENDKKEFITGINKIQQKFFTGLSEERIRALEEKEILITKRNDDEIINSSHICHQRRIQNGKYKKGETYELNSIVIKNDSIKKYKNFYLGLVQLVKPEEEEK